MIQKNKRSFKNPSKPMFLGKKPQNPSKFNSMAQIQIKCVKLSKPQPSSKTNRSNSSLNLTSPPQLKDLKEDSLFSLKPKVAANPASKISATISAKSQNSPNLSSNLPKNYFLLPNHSATPSTNSSLNRAKTLHQSKIDSVELDDSNKENFAQKCASPPQNSLINSSMNPKNTAFSGKSWKNEQNLKKTAICEEKPPNSQRSQFNRTLNSVQMKDIRETEEDFSEIKPLSEKNLLDFFCLRHPLKKVGFSQKFGFF